MYPIQFSYLMIRCVESVSCGDFWLKKRRTLKSLPEPFVTVLFHFLLHNGRINPSRLEFFKGCVDNMHLACQAVQSKVDSSWMVYLNEYTTLQKLSLESCISITSSSLKHLIGLNSLRALNLNYCQKINDSAIPHLLSLVNLEELQVAETSISSRSLSYLSHLRHLTSLNVGGLQIKDSHFASLQNLSELINLELWGGGITDNSLPTLLNFPLLEKLNLGWTAISVVPFVPSLKCLNLSVCKVEIFPPFDNLEELDLSWTHLKEPKVMMGSISVKSLRKLNIGRSNIKDLTFLREAKLLEKLDVTETAINDDCLADIAKCINLSHLNLAHTRITSRGLLHIEGKLPQLNFLSLEGTVVDGSALKSAASFPLLTFFSLKDTPVTAVDTEGFGFKMHGFFTKLESLDLQGVYIDEYHCEALGRIASLKILKLNGSSISDKCLPYLQGLKILEELCLNSTLITSIEPLIQLASNRLKLIDLRGCFLLRESNLRQLKTFSKACILHEVVNMTDQNKKPLSFWEDPLWSSFVSIKEDLPMDWSREKLLNGSLPLSFSKEQDERIKYSKEELLQIQVSLGLMALPGTVVLGPLRKI